MTYIQKKAPGGHRRQSDGMPSSKAQSNNNSNTNETRILPIINQDSKVVGKIEGDTFIKHVQASKHMLKTPKGWANDKFIIDQLIELEVGLITIHDDESGKIYTTTLENLLRNGFNFNRGFGDQICLTLNQWEVAEPPRRGLPLFEGVS